MKRKILYTATIISAIIIIFKTVVFANSGGAQYGVCGAPDDLAPNACGAGGCHNFTPIQDDPSFTIKMLDPSGNEVTAYNLNVKYTVRIELRRPSVKDCGFEATVESANDNSHVGKLTPKLKSQITAFNSNYVTHSTFLRTSPGYGKWEFYWTAPKTNPGDVIIYAAGNDGDSTDNASGFGDSIFTTTKRYSHNAGIENLTLNENGIKVFPNPAKDKFTVNYEVASAQNVTIDLFNIKGELVSELTNKMAQQGNNIAACNVSQLHSGMYFLKINAGNQTVVKKLMVNR